MIKKRFFLFVCLLLTSLLMDNKALVNASEEVISNEISFTITSGRTSSLLLSNQNKVYGWGVWGETNKINNSKKLVIPTDITSEINLEKNEEFIDVFSGEQHSFLLTNKGKVFAFGSGELGQLGYSDYLFKSKPTDITSLFSLPNNDKVTYISCGDDFNVVMTLNHRIFTFGNNEDGQLGIKKDTPIDRIYEITDSFIMQDNDYIVSIKSGADHSLALSNNGFLYGWGSNHFGQLALNDKIIYTPTLIDSIDSTITKIDCGRYTSYVLTNQAQLYGFGSDSHGQLATHDPLITSNKKDTPFLMNSGFAFESDEYIKDVIAGYYYAIVKTNLNNYYSFGENSSGQLANNSFLSTSVPQKIEYEALLDVNDEIVNISCGESHCIAISKQNHILAWGSNLQSQLTEESSVSSSNAKIIDITHNFPPIITISSNVSSVLYQSYILDVDVFYLDKQPIEETYFYISDSKELIDPTWVLYRNQISFSEYEGNVYVHIKVVSKKGTHYFVSNPYFLDHVAPTITIHTKNNEIFSSYYSNSTILAKALDNNNSVDIIYYHNGEKITTEKDTISFIEDGVYQIYAVDAANNFSATIEFSIDTILPTITQIDNNLILNSSYSTSEGQIEIKGSEALSCYKLGYNDKNDETYIALNDNEDSFTINLKKGVNTLTLVDLAGNESLTYEITYTPRFFQDTQLLLLVFGSLALVFIVIIIIVYTIRAKRKLVK